MPKFTFEHVHLFSPDPKKAVEFYQKNFDARLVETLERPNGPTSYHLDVGGVLIYITSRVSSGPTPQPQTPGLEHFGVITDDMAKSVAIMKANGVKWRDEPKQVRPGVTIGNLWGPDNVLIEFIERK